MSAPRFELGFPRESNRFPIQLDDADIKTRLFSILFFKIYKNIFSGNIILELLQYKLVLELGNQLVI